MKDFPLLGGCGTVVLVSLLFFGCSSARSRFAAPVPSGHHPVLHLFNSGNLNLYIYDDGEVSGTDLRDGRKVPAKFGQLAPAIADGLRAESLRLPDHLELAPSSLGGQVCHEGETDTILLSAFNSAGQEVTFEKLEKCRYHFNRTSDSKIGATLFRYSQLLHGWEGAILGPGVRF